MMQSISTHFRLSANHAHKQVMLRILTKTAEMRKLVMLRRPKILIEFLIDEIKLVEQFFDD